jgi:hypothetical protein
MNYLPTLLKWTKDNLPHIKSIIIASDNAGTFSNKLLVVYLWNLLVMAQNQGLPSIKRWIYSEAQTGKNMLDTHFSYVSLWLKSWVDEGNDIQTPTDIFNAMTCKAAHTTCILVDYLEMNNYESEHAKKINWIRSCHDIIVNIEGVSLRKFSNMYHDNSSASYQFIPPKFLKLKQVPKILSYKTSIRSESFLTDGPKRKRDMKEISSLKGGVALHVLELAIGDTDTKTIESLSECWENINAENETQQCWAGIGIKVDQGLSNEIKTYISDCFKIGQSNKALKVTSEQLLEDILQGDLAISRKSQLTVTITKVKQYLSMLHSKSSKGKWIIDEPEKVQASNEEISQNVIDEMEYEAAAYEDEFELDPDSLIGRKKNREERDDLILLDEDQNAARGVQTKIKRGEYSRDASKKKLQGKFKETSDDDIYADKW